MRPGWSTRYGTAASTIRDHLTRYIGNARRSLKRWFRNKKGCSCLIYPFCINPIFLKLEEKEHSWLCPYQVEEIPKTQDAQAG